MGSHLWAPGLPVPPQALTDDNLRMIYGYANTLKKTIVVKDHPDANNEDIIIHPNSYKASSEPERIYISWDNTEKKYHGYDPNTNSKIHVSRSDNLNLAAAILSGDPATPSDQTDDQLYMDLLMPNALQYISDLYQRTVHVNFLGGNQRADWTIKPETIGVGEDGKTNIPIHLFHIDDAINGPCFLGANYDFSNQNNDDEYDAIPHSNRPDNIPNDNNLLDALNHSINQLSATPSSGQKINKNKIYELAVEKSKELWGAPSRNLSIPEIERLT